MRQMGVCKEIWITQRTITRLSKKLRLSEGLSRLIILLGIIITGINWGVLTISPYFSQTKFSLVVDPPIIIPKWLIKVECVEIVTGKILGVLGELAIFLSGHICPVVDKPALIIPSNVSLSQCAHVIVPFFPPLSSVRRLRRLSLIKEKVMFAPG